MFILCDVSVFSVEINEAERQPSRQALEQLLLFGRELAAQNTQDEDLKRQVNIFTNFWCELGFLIQFSL